MVVGENDDARMQVSALQFGQHTASIHVGKLPAEHGKIEAGFSLGDSFEKCLASLHGTDHVEAAVSVDHVTKCCDDQRIAFRDQNPEFLLSRHGRDIGLPTRMLNFPYSGHRLPTGSSATWIERNAN